jgi:hypothetical protein
LVACSPVGKPSDLFVYTPEGKTKNIVYIQYFQYIEKLFNKVSFKLN